MDDIVRQAMAKWPKVPHCRGWLRLDARGAWRMRDERAQALDLPGDRIVHPVLLDFICRNYAHDDLGQWYFQNGPQRVYVDLEATPFIARTDPAVGFLLHTGQPLDGIDSVWMSDKGALILQSARHVAMLDDRDLGSCVESLRIDDRPIDEESLGAWLEGSGEPPDAALGCQIGDRLLAVKRIPHERLADNFGFVPFPGKNA